MNGKNSVKVGAKNATLASHTRIAGCKAKAWNSTGKIKNVFLHRWLAKDMKTKFGLRMNGAAGAPGMVSS